MVGWGLVEGLAGFRQGLFFGGVQFVTRGEKLLITPNASIDFALGHKKHSSGSRGPDGM